MIYSDNNFLLTATIISRPVHSCTHVPVTKQPTRVEWRVGREEENPQVKTRGAELLADGPNKANRPKGH